MLLSAPEGLSDMMQPKTKNDLISYYIDYPEKPQNVHCSFKTDSKEGIVFTTYRIPDIEEFSTLASVFVCAGTNPIAKKANVAIKSNFFIIFFIFS